VDEHVAIEKIWELMAHKLSGDATEGELNQLQSLLQQYPEEASSLEVLETIWNDPATDNHHYSEYQYKMLLQRMQKMGIDTSAFVKEEEPLLSTRLDINPNPYKNIIFTAKRMLFAASFVVAVIIGIFYYKSINKSESLAHIPSKCIISTKYGSKTSVTLPDGTKVWINAGSKLTYDNDFGNTLREVNLVGEAFFDVTHNAEKPFIIHTSKMDIRVLGTEFNVRCYPDEKKIETSLIRGRIEVTLKNKPDEKIYLKPDEKLILINDDIVEAPKPPERHAQGIELTTKLPEEISIKHLTYQPIDSAVVETCWVENRLAFMGDTFEEVAKKMEKWYGVNITIADEKLKQIHLTGSFEGETIDQALKALQITTTFNYTNNQNTIIITK
jgi:Fe2+-dicitrate sensor, membrane component